MDDHGNQYGVGADSLFWFLIILAIFGLIVGAVGRLLVPGPTPLGVVGTMGAGVAGAFIGGIIGRLLLGPNMTQGWMWVLSILGAALVVALVARRGHHGGGGYGFGRRRETLSDRTYDQPVAVHEVDSPYRGEPYGSVRRRRRFF